MPEEPKQVVKPKDASEDASLAKKSRPTDDASPFEGLEQMPPEQIRRFLSMTFQQTSRGASHPLLEKFESEHIDKWLDYCQRDDDNAFHLAKSSRWFQFAYVMLAVVVLGALLVYLLPNNQPILVDILKVLVGFVGGLGTGYGLRRTRYGK